MKKDECQADISHINPTSQPHINQAHKLHARTTTQRQNISNTRPLRLGQSLRDPLSRHIRARQVHVSQQAKASPRLNRQLQRQLRRRPTSAPSKIHKQRIVRCHLAQALVEFLHALGGLGRVELKGEPGGGMARALRQQVPNALVLICDDLRLAYGQGRHLRRRLLLLLLLLLLLPGGVPVRYGGSVTCRVSKGGVCRADEW